MASSKKDTDIQSELQEINNAIIKAFPVLVANSVECATKLSNDILRELEQTEQLPESLNDVCKTLVPSIVMLLYVQLCNTRFQFNFTETGKESYGFSTTEVPVPVVSTQHEIPTGELCHATTKLNTPCKRPHIIGSIYCKQHTKMQNPTPVESTKKLCGYQTKALTPCRNNAFDKYGGRCNAHKVHDE